MFRRSQLVNRILSEAARAGASDVHGNPQENVVVVRMRVAAFFAKADRAHRLPGPDDLAAQESSRAWTLPNEESRRMAEPHAVRGRRIDLRVATLPTQFGEKIVIRFLTPIPQSQGNRSKSGCRQDT